MCMCLVYGFVKCVILNTILSTQGWHHWNHWISVFFCTSVALFLYFCFHLWNETQQLESLTKLTRHESIMDSMDALFIVLSMICMDRQTLQLECLLWMAIIIQIEIDRLCSWDILYKIKIHNSISNGRRSSFESRTINRDEDVVFFFEEEEDYRLSQICLFPSRQIIFSKCVIIY